MLFEFSEDQYDFRDSVRSVLAGAAAPSTLRAVWDEPESGRGRAWKELASLGVTAVVVPEELGGLGAEPTDLVLALEEVGNAALAEPVAETALVAAILVDRWGSDDVRRELLPRLASGESAVGLAFGDTGLVPHARRVDHVLVCENDELHLVPIDQVERTPVATMDPSLAVDRCRFELSRATLLSADPAGVAHAHAVAAVATALVLLGVSQRMLDMTHSYVLERRQFGRIIGSYQALKHRMADVTVAIEAARGLAWFAGYRLGGTPGPDLVLAAGAAKAAAGRAAYEAGAAALQLHGGIGFTWEHDLHLWMQRAKTLEFLHGTTEQHRQAIGAWILQHPGEQAGLIERED